MANRNPIGGTFETINEIVVKPVTDEVGKAIEQGVQSVIGVPKPQPTQNPQSNSLQSTPVDNSKMLEARRRLDWYKNLESQQKRIREAQKQKQAEASKQVDEKKQIKQFEIVKKQKKDIALTQAKTKTEIRGGVGG